MGQQSLFERVLENHREERAIRYSWTNEFGLRGQNPKCRTVSNADKVLIFFASFFVSRQKMKTLNLKKGDAPKNIAFIIFWKMVKMIDYI